MISFKQKTVLISFFALALCILFLFYSHLMVTFISGLAVFLLIQQSFQKLSPHVHSSTAQRILLGTLALLVTLLLSGVGFGLYSVLHLGQDNLNNLSNDALNILQQLKKYLPSSVWEYLPDDLIEFKQHMASVLKAQSSSLVHYSIASVTFFAHLLLGVFLGSLVAFHCFKPTHTPTHPLLQPFFERLQLLVDVFGKVMGAQVKISLINTFFTGLFLLVVMPLFHTSIPYAKTLVVLTFLFGLLPVIGNLITNTLITLLAITVSFETALMALGFLVVVHKLEYYINAKIVGSKIDVTIWELLIAMIVFKTLFGILGLVMAPVLYGYLKAELQLFRL